MVTIGMNYAVLEGKETVFEAAFKSVLGAMSGMEGHDASQLYREVDDSKRNYLIVSRWSEESAFNAFIASDQFKKVTDWGSENILEGPPRHTTYREG